MTPKPRLRILFDHNIPEPLRRYLAQHTVDTADEKGWATIANGALIRLAEENGYHVLLTADQNIRSQQNINRAKIGIVALMSNRWPLVQLHTEAIIERVETVQPGQFAEIPIAPPKI